MEVRARCSDTKENVYIVEIEGKIDSYTMSDVEKALKDLVEKNIVRLIIDFKKVDYISSGGLRIFLIALKDTRKKQGDLKLANMIPDVEKIFKLAGFTKIFNIMDDIESAVHAFS